MYIIPTHTLESKYSPVRPEITGCLPSRMNIGQVLELHLGYAARELGLYYATPAFDGINSKDLENIMKAGVA